MVLIFCIGKLALIFYYINMYLYNHKILIKHSYQEKFPDIVAMWLVIEGEVQQSTFSYTYTTEMLYQIA